VRRAFSVGGVSFLRVFSSLFLAGILALQGCAELQRFVPPERVEFELAGRLAVRYREEASTGNVAWRHSVGGDEVLITTPVGSAVARIVREGDKVVLTTTDGTEHRAADVETLTERILGFRLPLAGLADWVRGRAQTGVPAEEERDGAGRMQSLRQSGWIIEYQVWQSDGKPSRLRLTYPGLDLRLAIHEWTPQP